MPLPKNISCWIITEGIAGTENQCLGIAEALQIAHPVVKRIDLRQPWRMLSPYLGFENERVFSPALEAPWPDLLIASGRKSIAASRYIKKQSQGRTFTVQIQDPRVDPAQFDLVIAPRHDPIRGENVFQTLAAPNRVHQQIQSASHELFLRLPFPRIAVLIGGNSKAYRITLPIAERLAGQLMSLHEGGASLMITASRRTGATEAALLRDKLRGEHVYFWDGTGENPYFAILAAADYIMVTADSVSMLSEACSTGKPVYMLPLNGGGKRIEVLHRNLIEHGAMRVFDGRLEEAWSYEPLNDAQIAADEIARRLYLRES